MALYASISRSTSLARRTLSASAVLLCLTMAGTNLVSAFAHEVPVGPGAVLSSDVTSSIGAGESTVLLTLSSNVSKEKVADDINAVIAGTVRDDYSALPILSVDNVNADELVALSAVQGIATIEPNRQMESLNFTTAEYLDWIKGTNVVANGSTLKGKDQIFGIMDSGINVNNPAFKDAAGNSRVIAQACIQNSADVKPCPAQGDPNPAHVDMKCLEDGSDPGCYHGNAVSALAVGNFRSLSDETGANFSVQGVAPEAKISFVRLALGNGGSFTGTDSFLAGLNKFITDTQSHPEIAPDVLNLSLGFELNDGVKCNDVTALHVAIKALDSAGVTVVAASGNGESKPLTIGAPACFDEVISVGATEFIRNQQGVITGEQVANYSATDEHLDVVAPGTNLALLYPDPTQAFAGDGTSFSSPIVAGAVLLLKQANPQITRAQISSVLKSTGDLVNDPAVGKSFPRINIQKAITAAVALIPAPTTPTTPTTEPVTTVPSTEPITTTPATNPATTVPGTSGSNTTVPGTNGSVTTVPVSVLGSNVSAASSTSAESLPYTGSSSTQLFYSALWILMAGVALLCYKEGFTRLALARAHVRR